VGLTTTGAITATGQPINSGAITSTGLLTGVGLTTTGAIIATNQTISSGAITSSGLLTVSSGGASIKDNITMNGNIILNPTGSDSGFANIRSTNGNVNIDGNVLISSNLRINENLSIG